MRKRKKDLFYGHKVSDTFINVHSHFILILPCALKTFSFFEVIDKLYFVTVSPNVVKY